MKLKKAIQFVLHSLGYYLYKYKRGLAKYEIDNEWITRIQDVIACSDNLLIEKVANAGKVIGNYQIMHNGIKIYLGSYYGFGYSRLLEANNGVHEPQEEYVFQEVLKHIPSNSTMIELGSFWSFYSMWFQKNISNSKNYLIEPEYINMLKGKSNFKLNCLKGNFFNAFVGKESINNEGIPTFSIDDFVFNNRISHVALLHSDIQGWEYDMLLGATNTFAQNLVDYVFISTHSNELHAQCGDFLVKHGFDIIASADLNETFSVDGILVAKHRNVRGPIKLPIHLKTNRLT
jgi:hypothetical protein